MNHPLVNPEKFRAVLGLVPGNIVKLTNGEEAEFVRMKQKKFIGKMKGKDYDIPVNMFVEKISDGTPPAPKAVKKADFDPTTLKPGELFYILRGNVCEMFAFDHMAVTKIHATNPVNGEKFNMPPSLVAGRVSDLMGGK